MRIGAAVLALGGSAALLSLVATGNGAGISPDSCHYLAMADNLLQGGGVATSITRWEDRGDTAAIGVWPPGFPLLLAAGRLLGLSPEDSSRIVLALAFAATVILTALLAGALEEAVARREDRPARPSCTLLAGALAVVSVPLLQLSAWVWSDLPFVAFCLLATLACLKAMRPGSPASPLWFAVGVVACTLAVMTRYAGVILWGTMAYWSWRTPGSLIPFRKRTLAAALLVPILAFAGWLLRNRMLAGKVLYGKDATLSAGTPALLLETLMAAIADVLPFPVYGHSLGDQIPWRPVATAAVLIGILLLILLPGFSASRIGERLQRHPEARFLLAAYGILLLGIAASAILRDLPPGRIEQRLLAPGYPCLLALAVVFAWPPPAGRGLPATPFLRASRIVALGWLAYALAAAIACILFSRARPGFAGKEFQERPSSEYLRSMESPRFATDFDVGVWYLTRRPVKLLPGRNQAEEIDEIANGGFDGALVLYRGPFRWAPWCVEPEGLARAGLLEHWARVADFPDCEIFLRRP